MSQKLQAALAELYARFICSPYVAAIFLSILALWYYLKFDNESSAC